MKKNRIFIFLSIIIAILVFGVAATCSFCGTPVSLNRSDKDAGGEDGETVSGDETGPYTLTIEVSDDDGGIAAHSIDMNFIALGPVHWGDE